MIWGGQGDHSCVSETGSLMFRGEPCMVIYQKLVLQMLRSMVMNLKNQSDNHHGSIPVFDNRPTLMNSI